MIRFSAFGDVLLTLPVLGPLAASTSSEVIFITREPYGKIVERHPDVVAVYTIPPRPARGGRRIKEVCERINAEYSSRVKRAVDLHRTPLSRYALSRIKAEQKITYRKHGLARLLLVLTGADVVPRPTKKVPEIYADAVRPWGVGGPDYDFRLPLDEKRAAGLLDAFGLTRGYIAIFPGAVYPTKAWPEERYAELAVKLAEAGNAVVVLGAPAESDACVRVAEAANALNLAGDLRLDDLPEVLSAAAAVVGNDSAPSHLAPLVGAPAITIFGPTTPRFGFAPWGERSKYLYADLPCSPCSRHGKARCWRDKRYCFESISVEEVFEAVLEAGENP